MSYITINQTSVHNGLAQDLGSLDKLPIQSRSTVATNMPPKSFKDGRESALHAHIMSLRPVPTSASEVVNAIDDYRSANNARMMVFQQPKIEASRTVLESLPSPPKTLVELGGYTGQSAVAWGGILRSLNSAVNDDNARPKIFSIELEQSFVPIIEDFARLAKLSDVVQVIQGHLRTACET